MEKCLFFFLYLKMSISGQLNFGSVKNGERSFRFRYILHVFVKTPPLPQMNDEVIPHEQVPLSFLHPASFINKIPFLTLVFIQANP